MKGTILEFSIQTNTGIIAGDDGKRYSFTGIEWKDSAHPIKGIVVDFEPNDNLAVGIYALSAVSKSPELPPEYQNYYKSTDDKVFSGVCAGIAHKWNVSVVGVRLAFAVLGLCYFIGIILYIILSITLKGLPTKIAGHVPSRGGKNIAPNSAVLVREDDIIVKKTESSNNPYKWLKIAGVIFLGIIVIDAVKSMPRLDQPSNGTETSNIANARIAALSEKDRRDLFTSTSKTSGVDCAVTSTFFNGIGREAVSKGKAFWSIRCENGTAYMVEVDPDVMGSSKFIECGVLKKMHAGICFKKFAE